jgi:hypothetical protein
MSVPVSLSVLALMAATYVSPLLGLAFAAGGVWSLMNLQVLEKLVVSVMGPARTTPEGIRGAGFSLMGMLILLAGGALLLSLLSPMALLLGFLLPLAVIVLKAASQVLLGSRVWTGIVNHRSVPLAAVYRGIVVRTDALTGDGQQRAGQVPCRRRRRGIRGRCARHRR